MPRFLTSYFKRYPFEGFLMLFNIGVFSTTSTISQLFKNSISQSATSIYQLIPNEFHNLPFINQLNTNYLMNSFLSYPFKWLITSIILTIIFRFVSRVVRFLLSLIILVVGAYLAYVYFKASINLF